LKNSVERTRERTRPDRQAGWMFGIFSNLEIFRLGIFGVVN
jgi:hypothetical protein